jgi:predicted DNA-binding WGR domain protein
MSRREFQLIEGDARKFWSIELEGAAHTVRVGRIGTAGQTQRKEFATAAEARSSHDKLVAEKLKKGYNETSVTASAAASPAIPAAAPTSRKPGRAKADPEAKETPTPPPEPAPAAAAAGPPLSTARSIDLEPEDWLWATWRPRTPLPRPEPAPFDLDDGLRRLAGITSRRKSGVWDWNKAGLAPAMTRQEAHFWLVAVTAVSNGLKPQQLVARLRAARRTFTGAISATEALRELRSQRLGSGLRSLPGQFIVPLMTLFSADEWLDLWQETLNWAGSDDLFPGLLDGFRRHALPYLTEAEHRTIRDTLRPRLGTPSLPRDYFHTFPMADYLAAILGLHDEIAAIVQSIPDDYYTKQPYCDRYQLPQFLVLGLGDPRRVESEMRRLKLVLRRPEYIRGWLAHTEFSALDQVRDSVLSESKRDQCAALLQEFARVKAPAAAPAMLELMLASKAPAVARRWLDEQPGHAIAGLIAATTVRGKVADAALEYLREQRRKGREDFIRACLDAAPPDAAEKVRRGVLDRFELVALTLDAGSTPDWLRSALEEAKRLKPPTWIGAGGLPPILVGGRRLGEDQVGAVLAALARSTLNEPHPLVAGLKAHADRVAIDTFAQTVFERWILENAPPKERWAMAALGLLGSEASAIKLTPLIRTWPGESLYQRAVFGLECLRAIGSDAALMQLHSLAQRVPSRGLREKAAGMMEAIAQDRGLSRAELEDRIVPDCGLDERGSRVFDFGPRRFRFALGAEMKPMVRDEAGRLRDDLPKPTTKDDPLKAAAAVEEWRRLKKQVRAVAKVQAERLERAMFTRRRWRPADFHAFLVRHPLMIHLVRSILWGSYDERGALVATFRVTEERDYADLNEAPDRIEGSAQVGVVHPLHLSAEQVSAWAEVFNDYELLPPFPQLGRTVHRLEPDELQAKALLRNQGIMVPAVTLVGILERHGWNRGLAEGGGLFREHTKSFEGANVTAVIQYNGIVAGSIAYSEDQDVERCFFATGIPPFARHPRLKDALRLDQVDPVVVSEVLGTLAVLASKGK